MSIQQDRLRTRAQAAQMLQLKTQTLAKWAMDGRHLPVVRIGRMVRYRQSDVQKLIDRGVVGETE